MKLRLFLSLFLAIGLTACATAPTVLKGEYAEATPLQAPGDGVAVRWGGSIIRVEPKSNVTCFQVLSRPLSANARPRHIDATDGRFLACKDGFYDPALFRRGREITVVGKTDGYETRRIGEFDYRLPKVAADAIYLWPRYDDSLDPFYSQRMWLPYYDPFFRPYVRYRVIRHRPKEN